MDVLGLTTRIAFTKSPYTIGRTFHRRGEEERQWEKRRRSDQKKKEEARVKHHKPVYNNIPCLLTCSLEC